MKKAKTALLAAFLVITAITSIHPIYPQEQMLQHAGTLLLLIPLVYDLFRGGMPMSAYIGLVLFGVLHVIGARYIYSYVPYKEWFTSLGIVDSGYFQDPRNHYDRFVHLCFGLLLFPYVKYICQSWLGQKAILAIFMAWLIIQAGSLLYELFEWMLSNIMDPQDAENYNGQQGDMFDAQKDMALAMLGSTFMALIYLIFNKSARR